MSRTGSPVGILVLLDMYEVPVEIGDENGKWCTVGQVMIARTFDGVGRIDARVDDRQVRFQAGGRKLISPRFPPWITDTSPS